ncbi:MAG TPA: HAD-IA family hydrolase [Spirochaetota bacterium]|nr:HAD-IA family hydrolase [Spirochaetota bacterium]
MKLAVDPRARGLIFDVDGTLADTEAVHMEAWRQVLQPKGYVMTDGMFRSLTGAPTRKIITIMKEEYGWDLDPEETLMNKEKAFMEQIGSVKAIEPVAALAREYKGTLPMSLGTGGRREMALITIKAAGLADFFDILVSADDVERHKPEPDTFLECARFMGVAPEVCQVFEDGDRGIEAGRRAGMIVTDVRPYITG